MKRSPALVIFGRLWLFWAVLSIIMAEGATNTWDGGGADDSWSIGENWNPDGAMPVSASNTRLSWMVLIVPARFRISLLRSC